MADRRVFKHRVPGRLSCAALALLPWAMGCSSSGPPRGLEPPDLFAWSQGKFDGEEYNKASAGFLAYLIRDPLSPLFDSAQYMAAEAQLRAGHELEAIEEFKRLATGRPNSPWADDAQYGACRGYLSAAPKLSLSQEFTRLSLEECQRLIQFFPTSQLRADAEARLTEAQARLAEKSYEIGRYYQDNRKLFESAIVYYEKALAEGPSQETLPDLLKRLHKSYSEVGFDTEAQSILDRLLSEFPDSPEAASLRDGRGHEDAPGPVDGGATGSGDPVGR